MKFDLRMKPSARIKVVKVTRVHQKLNGLLCRKQPAWSQDGDRWPGLGEGTLVCQPGKSSICRLNSPLSSSPFPRPLLPSTSTSSTSFSRCPLHFSFPWFPRWQRCSRSLAYEGSKARELLGGKAKELGGKARELGGESREQGALEMAKIDLYIFSFLVCPTSN